MLSHLDNKIKILSLRTEDNNNNNKKMNHLNGRNRFE